MVAALPTTSVDWLVDPPMRESTPYCYRHGDKRVRPVEVAVVHWTASPMGGGVNGTNEPRIRAWGRGERGDNSSHFVILRDGRLLQLCPLSSRAWHAGGSTWIDPQGVPVKNVNSRAIGIDLECVGNLRKVRGEERFFDSYGGAFAGPAEIAGSRWWEAYRDEQIATLHGLAALLCAVLPQLKDPARWTGHEDIRKTKIDPGPHFPWWPLRKTLEALP